MTQAKSVSFTLPEWLASYIDGYSQNLDMAERARFVIGAAKENIVRNTGGPFAAAIFESETGILVSLGVNLVPSEQLSCLHAEIVALTLAQRHYSTYDLSAGHLPKLELISSTEPCAMCLGAIPWSGVPTVISCASGEDACEVGFDEGDKPNHWADKLSQKGISLTTEFLRDEAKAVFTLFKELSGEVYNGGNR